MTVRARRPRPEARQAPAGASQGGTGDGAAAGGTTTGGSVPTGASGGKGGAAMGGSATGGEIASCGAGGASGGGAGERAGGEGGAGGAANSDPIEIPHLANASTFRAYLSSATDDALCHILGASGKGSAACGLSSLPLTTWRRIDGYPLGNSQQLLAASTEHLLAPVLYTASGLPMPTTQTRPWTGVSPNGVAGNCNDWSSTNGNGYAGVPNAIDAAWFLFTTNSCSTPHQVYCFES